MKYIEDILKAMVNSSIKYSDIIRMDYNTFEYIEKSLAKYIFKLGKNHVNNLLIILNKACHKQPYFLNCYYILVDGKLDEENIKNYLLTNENITNYIYHFRIRYYDKVFRNNDIYGVYPDLSNLPDYMENAEMEENGSPYGNFISDRKTIEEDKIDNINYILKVKNNLISIICIILIFILIIKFFIYYAFGNFLNFYKEIIGKKEYFNPLSVNEERFIIVNCIIVLILFIFQFWLGFPGYFQWADNYVIIGEAIANNYSNWHPVIISLTLHFLYKIFGVHSYYLFFINLFLFYLGLALIIISLYHRFKTKKVLLIYLLIFIKDIYFLKRVWIKYIFKYPINYIKHINRFFIEFCIKNNKSWWLMNSDFIQKLDIGFNNAHIPIINRFNSSEQKITFTPLREKIYNFLFNSMVHIPIIFCVISTFIIFIINFILIFIKRIFDSNLLIYSFSVSFSSIATIFIVVSFTPVVDIRYIYPVYPISIISLISFFTFIKELQGEKK
ncbi:hypothetical protein EPJ69_10305 [Brachyspira aalborgi]|uniref:Uncharacterized protein n=1 Tax=Brachyspira aalborgi TaxID=29522 RepID=A0A5C8DXT3_9SPIR|nr:hypothetical protein [Brachyspira aalborgi]TXJ30449.1 hypothetical protein EPJ69_10305 [Brachyspira aalborgi]